MPSWLPLLAFGLPLGMDRIGEDTRGEMDYRNASPTRRYNGVVRSRGLHIRHVLPEQFRRTDVKGDTDLLKSRTPRSTEGRPHRALRGHPPLGQHRSPAAMPVLASLLGWLQREQHSS